MSVRTKLIDVTFAIPPIFFIFNYVFAGFPPYPKRIFNSVMCISCSFCLSNVQHSYTPSQICQLSSTVCFSPSHNCLIVNNSK